ncbi:MAG: DNA repair protein RecO [Thermaerobacter sp.]|nr:DNA repair protein RecO [Thermaerobacter sp.]
MALYQDQVVTLKARPYRDHDALLTLFGRRHGKIAAVARGVRRSKSKLAGQLHPLTFSAVTLYHGRSSLDTVTEADLQKGFPRIAEDLARLGWAMVLADVVDQLLPEREASAESFVVLLSALDALNQRRHAASVGLRAGFRLLALAGFSPDWSVCSGCSRAINSGPITVDVATGELYCGVCRPESGRPQDRISLGSLRSLQYWLNDYPNKFDQADVKGQMEEELKRLFFRYLLHETAKPLKSYEFLSNIDRLAEAPEGGDRT